MAWAQPTPSAGIDGWTFVALKPPLNVGSDSEVQSGSVSLKPGEMRYLRKARGDGSFDFTVFVPSRVSDDPDGYRRLLEQSVEQARRLRS